MTKEMKMKATNKTMADLIEHLYYGNLPITDTQVAVLAREFAVERYRRIKGEGKDGVGNILTFADGSYTHTSGGAKFTAGHDEELEGEYRNQQDGKLVEFRSKR